MEEKYIQELCKLIEIPSVFSEEAVEGGPFGQEVKAALEEVLDFGERLGFTVKNYDGYAGELTMGTGTYMIGVLCHIDVVSAGPGWAKEPFSAVLEGEKLYGRGSSDDKGPLMAALSAISRLAKNGEIPEDVSIRVIIGTNEEEAWEGIHYYLDKVDSLPEVSFVPDGVFPVIFCEKGLLDLDLKVQAQVNPDAEVKLLGLWGGEGRNVVAPGASAKLKCEKDGQEVCRALEKAAAQNGFEVKTERAKTEQAEEEVKVTVEGKSAHAMTPEKGINAISRLIAILCEGLGDRFSHSDFAAGYMNVIGHDIHGEAGGFCFSDEESGMLTFNVGTVTFDGEGICLQANARYPASLEHDFVFGAIRTGLGGGGLLVEETDYLPPVSFKTDSPLIETLMEAYREVTGDMASQPVSMGGATYARAIPNAVSFGALFPDEEELAHGPDEYVSLESLEKAENIYYTALQKLIDRRMLHEK